VCLIPQGWVVAAQTSRPTTSSAIRSSTVQCVREVGTWLGLLKKRGSVLAASIIRMLVLSGDCGCVRAGKDKRKNLDEGNEDAATDVGKKERQNVPPQAPSQHRHATVHIDCALGVEILENGVVLLLTVLFHQAARCWHPVSPFPRSRVASPSSLAECNRPLPALVPSVPSLTTSSTTALEIPLQSVPTFFHLGIGPVGSHVVVDLLVLKGKNSFYIELVAEVDRGEDGGELQEEHHPHQAGVHSQQDPVLGRCCHKSKDGEEEEHDSDGDDEVGHRCKVLGEEPEAGKKIEVDKDAAKVEHGRGGAEQQQVESPQKWLIGAHLPHHSDVTDMKSGQLESLKHTSRPN